MGCQGKPAQAAFQRRIQPRDARGGLAGPGLGRYTSAVRRDLPCGSACLGCGGILRMARFIVDLLSFVSYLLTLYVYVLIAAAVMSWLVAFNVVNPRSPVVAAVGQFLYAITEPILRPIRNLLPNLGGIDISPVVVILVIIFLQNVIIPNLQRALLT